MKKTYKEFSTEINEVLSFGARKATGRRMAMLNRKPSTQVKKIRNMLKSLPINKARLRAQKWVRNWVKQKLAGKGKDLTSMTGDAKANLEKKADKKMKAMGAKAQALVNKKAKMMITKHKERKASLLAKKTPGQ
tara:strand:- start:32 stop:433 length:402 start_codon:yes stop_codon:yes gene_type:complete